MYWGPATKCPMFTASGAVTTGPCLVFGVYIRGVTNGVDFNLRDGGAAGAIIATFGGSTATTDYGGFPFPVPLQFKTDCYIDFIGVAPKVSILYQG